MTAAMNQVIPIGYKQTEIGVIPEDWELLSTNQLGAIIDGDRGTNYPNGNDFNNYGYCLFLNAKNVTKKGFRFSECQFITKEKDKRLNKGKLNRGDIVLTTRGTVGNIAFFDENIPYDNIRINSGMVILRINESNGIISGYFYKLCQSDLFSKQIDRLTFGSAQPQITVKGISSFQFPIPSQKKEQVIIAATISDADSLIDKLENLIEKKKYIKQGVMQQLLTGKKRLAGFSGKWEKKKLGDLADITKGQGLSRGKLSLSGKYSCILYGELFTIYKEEIKKVYSKTNYNEGQLSKHGDILIPGSTTTTGIDLAKASALLADNILLGGDINIIRQLNNSYNPIFLAYCLTHIYRNAIAQKTKGITIHHLQGKDLCDLRILMPDEIEQKAISKVLSDMDSEIEKLETELNKYKNIKQGMMQNLLTGKIRLIKK